MLPAHNEMSLYSGQGSVSLFACGFPEASYEFDCDRRDFGFELQLLPLHPNPDEDEESVKVKREVSSRGFFHWIPTSWGSDQSGTSICGVSGGPVVMQSSQGQLLVGVATREKPIGDPNYVGVCEASSLLHVIRDIVRDN